MSTKIAILGASARAAAFSALRAGFVPVGLDLFADWDLSQRAAAIRVRHYPAGVEAAAAQQDVDAWIYTGGVENYPELIDRMAEWRPLLGNRGVALRAVRDPFRCAEAFRGAGIPCPSVADDPLGLPCDGSWLEKPLRGSGGAGIRPWTGEGAPPHGKPPARFFQQRIPGAPCSAVFVGADGRSALLGATWQLVGTGWTGAGEFCYAGSVGPIALPSRLETQWRRIGNCIAGCFELVGLFGVDAIFDGRTVWPVEVNPRYPASVEVLEKALEIQAMRIYADACRLRRLPDGVPRARNRWCGKAILYAPADAVASPEFGRFAQEQMSSWPWPDLADVPEVGIPLRKGRPVTTVFAEAADEASLRAALRRNVEEVKRVLYGPSQACRAPDAAG